MCNDNSLWKNANVCHNPIEDLFECKNCQIEFGLESNKIKNKKIFCPVCKIELKAWQKNWQT
jgi:Zn finger protein HypA/HybF involved in hydrogenase expression